MTLYDQKGSNIRKTWFLFTTFLIVVIAIGWLFSRVYGNPSILYFAVIFSVLMNVVAYWYSDKIVLKMAKAVPVEKKTARNFIILLKIYALPPACLCRKFI